MRQITILYDINLLGRVDISRRLMIGLFLLFSVVFGCGHARGPHHPRSDVNRRVQQQQHINEHLAVDTKHIEEDLHAQQIPTPKSVDEMTDEEKNYFFFKVHDLDGNDKLDGLEIFYSATHHSEAESLSTDSESHHHHHHEHEEQTETVPAIESTDNEIDKTNESKTTDEQSSDSTQNSSETTNLKLLEIDGNDDGGGSKNINHIIDVLDNFLNLADLNNDGYLNYAEYAAAVKLGNAMANAEQHPEL